MMEGDNNVENGARAYFSRTVRPGPGGAVTDSARRSARMETQGDRVDTQALENGGSPQRETAELGEFCQRAGWAASAMGRPRRAVENSGSWPKTAGVHRPYRDRLVT